MKWCFPLRLWRVDRGTPRLRRDIVLALAIKAVLLLALYQLFFAPHLRPRQDPGATATAVLGGNPEEVTK